jgi:hypothetical protein
LLRVPALALRPDAMVPAFFAVVACGILMSLPIRWEEGRTLAQVWRETPWREVLSGGYDTPGGFLAHITDVAWMCATPIVRCVALVRDHVWAALALGLPILVIACFFGCAIARVASCEFGRAVRIPWPAAIGFAIKRLGPLSVAVFGPACVAGLVSALVMVGGSLLFRWEIMGVLGGALYFAALGVSAFAVFLFASFSLGWPMIVPAVACECSDAPGKTGGDGIDALQRVLAYVPNSPLRLFLYSGILIAQFSVLLYFAAMLADALVSFTSKSAGAFAGVTGRAVLAGETEVLGGLGKTASQFVSFWNNVPHVVVAALAFSFVFSGGTVMYLLLRRLNDGQDESEIAVPGDKPLVEAAPGLSGGSSGGEA